MNFNYSLKKKPESGDFEIVITGDNDAWKVLKNIRILFQDAINDTVKEIMKEIKLSDSKTK